MSDRSITATTTIHIGKLIIRLDESDDPHAREAGRRLRDAMAYPDRRIGSVLAPKRKGGRSPSRAGLFEQRDDAISELTELQPGKRRSARIQEARQKLDRYAANGWPRERDKTEDTGNRERDLMRQIMRIGLPVPGERQHRKIVSARSKK